MVALLDAERIHWHVVLIQEGPAKEKTGCTIIEGGRLFYFGASGPMNRTTCILLHRRSAEAKMSFHHVSDRVVFLDIEI